MLRICFTLLLFLLPNTAVAAVWRCVSSNGHVTFTDVPVNNSKQNCLPARLNSRGYNKIPIEKFSSRARFAQEETKSIAPEETEVLDIELRLFTSSSYREVTKASGRNKRKKFSDAACHLRGVARADKAQLAVVRVRRGALTEDFIELSLKGDFEANPWETIVDGPCRRAKIEMLSSAD